MKKKKVIEKSGKEKPRDEDPKEPKPDKAESHSGVLPPRDLKKNLGCG